MTRTTLAACLAMASAAHAGTVQAPEGGKPVPVVAKGVACGPLEGGWTIDAADRSKVVPPPAGAPNLLRALAVRVADGPTGCAASKQTVNVIALGAWPELDAAGATFWPDDGRLELRGQRLAGLRVAWAVPGDDKKHGVDVCLDPAGTKAQTCAIPLAPGLPANAELTWLPAYGRFEPDAAIFDAAGNRVDYEALRVRPAKIVLTKPLVQTGGIDVSSGPAKIVLAHPQVVASVDCAPASCELVDGAVSVRGVPEPLTAITLHLRLAPRVFAARGDALDTQVTTSVPLLACPMTAIEGTVVRDVDDAGAVVRLDPKCGRDPNSLRWTASGVPAEVHKVVKQNDGMYVLLHLDRITAERVTITAARPDLGNTIVASAIAKSTTLAEPHVHLELRGHGRIDFVPTNRPADISVAGNVEPGRLVPIAIGGAYTVGIDNGATTLRAAPGAEGFVSLRFAYRVPSLPGELATADLAITSERVQRAVHEAAVPAAIGASAYGDAEHALVELVCGGTRVKPGELYALPYDARASCRVVLHQERLTAADGSQELTLDVDVTKADATPRADAKVSEHVVLRPGGEPRVIAIKGALSEFDRVDVRVSHVIDESRYVVGNAVASKPGTLAAQWSAIVEGGRFRLYATATIPAGLYRVNAPSGQLTLNFGVLSRLTTLSRTGKEGLLGLELGLMGVGLAPQSGNIEFPRTLAIVSGLGLRVPLGQGATIGIDAWVAYELRDGAIYMTNPDGSRTAVSAGAWSFIFGPSISFGNVGFNL